MLTAADTKISPLVKRQAIAGTSSRNDTTIIYNRDLRLEDEDLWQSEFKAGQVRRKDFQDGR